jgi:hypothetical protein
MSIIVEYKHMKFGLKETKSSQHNKMQFKPTITKNQIHNEWNFITPLQESALRP